MSASHGGSVAISGYLYQLLAVTDVQVSAGPGEKKGHDDDAFVVIHEWLDEDAALATKADKSVAFVQVKYSENGETARISTKELKAIVKRFAKATSEALKKNWDVSGYILLSNRGLSVPAQNLLKAAHTAIKKPVAKKKKIKVGAKAKKNEPWSPAQKPVATRLVDWLVPSDVVIENLKRFAGKYGVLDHEFDNAVRQLMAKIFNEVAALRESGVTLKDWINMLTGSRDAVSLERADQKDKQQAELAFITSYDQNPYKHLPREVTQNLFALNPQYSLFVFHGKGGMGKTASLRHLAKTQSDLTPGPFIKGVLAIDAMDHWASQCADVWRNAPVSTTGTIEDAIKRLQKANPDIRKQPVLTIALDGIDERMEHEAVRDLRKLLILLKGRYDPNKKNETTFKLVITCRDLEELKKHLPHDASDVDERPLDWFKAIAFEEFNTAEFRDIVVRDAKKFAPRLTPEPAVSSPLPSLSAEKLENDERVAASRRYQYLRDPLAWREFLSLEEDVQEALLDEKEPAIAALGEKIFDRFVRKALRRRSDMQRATFLNMMKAAATEMEGKPYPWTCKDWCEKGTDTKASTESQALVIFHEAYEAGLIDGGEKSWTWRNTAIPTYLKNAHV